MKSTTHTPFLSPKGRGTGHNPANRFTKIGWEADEAVDLDAEYNDASSSSPATQFFPDHSKTILSYNKSPDVGFNVGINPYRGCEHGCSYCYARQYHEYLGLSAGLDFETKIWVKPQAPQLLRQELSARKWKPQVIALSGATDCYQPVEKKFRITRGCLEVLAEFRNPVALITKNRLVTRDVDVLQELARHQCVAVYISITSLDRNLSRKLEPRASMPQDRLLAVEILAKAGIPVGVMVAPVIPALNDMEIPAILQAAGQAGAVYANYVLLRLPYGVQDLFFKWLEQHYPERRQKVLHRLEEIRTGKIPKTESQHHFGKRMRGRGLWAVQLAQIFSLHCRKYGLARQSPYLKTEGFRRVSPGQIELF